MVDLNSATQIRCPICGQWTRATARFCVHCGSRLVAEALPVQGFYTQLAQLQTAMTGAFSLGELKDVAFELGIVDFASLPGETKEEKARELIWRMVREDRLSQLLTLCRRERPSVAWPFVEQGRPDAAPVNPLEDVFRLGIRHQLSGDLAAALQAFEGIQRIDPNYPGLQAKLSSVRYELGRRYVGPDGRIVARDVYFPPASVAPPTAGARPPDRDAVPLEPARARRVWPILIVALVLLLSLTVMILWLVSR